MTTLTPEIAARLRALATDGRDRLTVEAGFVRELLDAWEGREREVEAAFREAAPDMLPGELDEYWEASEARRGLK